MFDSPEETSRCATAHAIPKPSQVDVPRPNSSTITNEPLNRGGSHVKKAVSLALSDLNPENNNYRKRYSPHRNETNRW